MRCPAPALAVALALLLPSLSMAGEAGPGPREVEPVTMGEPSPITGLAMTEYRFRVYVEQQLRAEKAEARGAALEKSLAASVVDAEMCHAKMEASAGQRNFWIGVGVGAVVATALAAVVAYGVVEVARTLK